MWEKLEQHHVKYKELHGEDEIVMLTHSEHIKLHRRLRREGKCNVPVEELNRISKAAHNRTRRGKQIKRGKITLSRQERIGRLKICAKVYEQTERCKATRLAYRQSEKGKAVDRAAHARQRLKIKQ